MNCKRPIKEYIHPPVLGQRKPGPEKLGKYQLFLKPSPLAFDQKIATDTSRQNGKGQEGQI